MTTLADKFLPIDAKTIGPVVSPSVAAASPVQLSPDSTAAFPVKLEQEMAVFSGAPVVIARDDGRNDNLMHKAAQDCIELKQVITYIIVDVLCACGP